MTTQTNSATGSYSSSFLAAVNGTGKTTSGTSTTEEASNRFLRLLTTQLQNQDPLNPLDNAQMTSQLAQINTVDGIERLNQTLQTLLSDSQNAQGLQAAALVGRGVLVPGNSMTLASGKGGFGVELAGAADELTATIKNADGLVVRTLKVSDLESGVQVVAWDGKTDSGEQAVDGKYTVSIAAQRDKKSVSATVLSATQVTGLIRTGATMSVEAGGAIYALSDVKGIV